MGVNIELLCLVCVYHTAKTPPCERGVRKTVTTVVDGETVSVNSYEIHFSQGDDISAEDALFQNIANHYWSTL